METNIKKQNEEALLNAFKIEELEERLEMSQAASSAPWTSQCQRECNNMPH